MLLDCVLCEVGTLGNGTTITRVPLLEFEKRYTVYHLEPVAHEVVLVNGAPMETFVGNVSRRAFDNLSEFEESHGENPPEMEGQPYPAPQTPGISPCASRADLASASLKNPAGSPRISCNTRLMDILRRASMPPIDAAEDAAR